MMPAWFIYESCTPAPAPIDARPTPLIAAPAEPLSAPAGVPPADGALPPTPGPEEEFRAWVDAWIGVNSRAGVARWSGQFPVAKGGAIAFEALVCAGAPSGGTHQATWLVEVADGRRWSIPGGTDETCWRAYERPPFAVGPARDRVTLSRGNGVYSQTHSWSFDETGPYVYAATWHEPNTWRIVDAEGCVETSERRVDGKVTEHLVGRPAGCGGYGEIPIVEAHGRKPIPSLKSELLRGVTDATFQVHAELDANGFIVLVASIPPVDAPAPKRASIDRLRVSDHFEVWFDEYHSPFAVVIDEQGTAAFAPLEPEGLAGTVVISTSRGEVRIATGRGRYPEWDDPLPATVIFVDGDGQKELGAVSSGPLVAGRPNRFNRVASSAWRFQRDVDHRRESNDGPEVEAPAARYQPAP